MADMQNFLADKSTWERSLEDKELENDWHGGAPCWSQVLSEEPFVRHSRRPYVTPLPELEPHRSFTLS